MVMQDKLTWLTFTIIMISLFSKSLLYEKYPSGNNANECEATAFLEQYEKLAEEDCFLTVLADWKYNTNLTNETKQNYVKQAMRHAKFEKAAWKNITSFAWKNFSSPVVKRQFKKLSILGSSVLEDAKLKELEDIVTDMIDAYSTAKICVGINNTQCNSSLDPDILSAFANSRNYEELKHIWVAWRNASGKTFREKYLTYVKLGNEAAVLNGFPDMGTMWREVYETSTFIEDLENIWKDVKPLYMHLHAYTRKKLISLYGNDKIKKDGPIPGHLLGNMWAQSWDNLIDILQPYPDKHSEDVTSTMMAKNLTALDIVKIAEEFFITLGLKPMRPEFWRYSILEKPMDREIVCHASAWDFCNRRDFRIKQCITVSLGDLITTHHEMGHIQYYMQYASQPFAFRDGANPGFHEAIGDVISLSVSTPNHFKKIGFINEVTDNLGGNLNFLMDMALQKIVFLPYAYSTDLWRWALFSGKIKPEEMNSKYWELSLKYMGVCSPVTRTEEDFDPGSKYHVAADVPYIRYFVSNIVQFQFHKSLCKKAGFVGPLHKCDIYKSTKAGELFSDALKLGSSKPWQEVMKVLTEGAADKMDSKPILEYFNPLLLWLKKQNKGEVLGWSSKYSTTCL